MENRDILDYLEKAAAKMRGNFGDVGQKNWGKTIRKTIEFWSRYFWWCVNEVANTGLWLQACLLRFNHPLHSEKL